jgi:hypothetical protein
MYQLRKSNTRKQSSHNSDSIEVKIINLDNGLSVLDFLNRPKEDIKKDLLTSLGNSKKADLNDKLILIISVLFNHRHFQHDLNVLNKIIDIVGFLNEKLMANKIATLGRLYFILPENSSLKSELLQIYFHTLLQGENNKELTAELINDFNKRKYAFDKKDLAKIYSAISKYIVQSKNYTFLQM